jgi:5-methyltetrahydrofolate--homocysteine methyltransferase
MLARLIEGRWLTANGVMALLPANTVNDDDIEIYTDESRSKVALTWNGLRQQSERPVVDGVRRPNRCLADFIAPKSSGVADYIGLFAVTAGIGVDKKEAQFEADHDDYSAIMLKALADRLAEPSPNACTSVQGSLGLCRRDAEQRSADRRGVRGIRPAPGYPACPEHTVKAPMFAFSMRPTSAWASPRAGHDAGGIGERLLPVASGLDLLQRRQDRPGPARRYGGPSRRDRLTLERALAPNL